MIFFNRGAPFRHLSVNCADIASRTHSIIAAESAGEIALIAEPAAEGELLDADASAGHQFQGMFQFPFHDIVQRGDSALFLKTPGEVSPAVTAVAGEILHRDGRLHPGTAVRVDHRDESVPEILIVPSGLPAEIHQELPGGKRGGVLVVDFAGAEQTEQRPRLLNDDTVRIETENIAANKTVDLKEQPPLKQNTAPQKQAAENKKAAVKKYKVKAVFDINQHKSALVNVDGQDVRVEEGTEINGATVAAISPNSVILQTTEGMSINCPLNNF